MENAIGRTGALTVRKRMGAAWRHGVLGALAAALLPGVAAAGNVPAAGGLVPHMAAYSLRVLPNSSGAGILGGRGVLQLEWRRDCEGMAYSQQSLLTLNSDDGSLFDSTVRIESWEAADASVFRFLMENSIDSQVTEEVSGLAKRGQDGTVTVRYTAPEDRREVMPADTVFPWQQMRAVLAAAQHGEHQLWYRMLRGEAQGDPVGVSVRISRREGPPQTVQGGDAELLPAEGWRVASAFFEDKVASEPAFESAETMLASGVITRAEITYPDMIMRLKLERLKRGPAPDCSD